MSSSPVPDDDDAEDTATPRRLRNMTLRGRLLAALVAMLALICLIVGVVT